MQKNHQSHSTAQCQAEEYLRIKLNEVEGLNLKPQKIQLLDNTYIEPDGYDEEAKTLCEIYARIGKLKSSQRKKLASDILKMLLVEQSKGYQIRKILCFASEEAKKYLDSNSWLNYAKEKFKIETIVIQLTPELEKQVLEAQKSQKMVNQT